MQSEYPKVEFFEKDETSIISHGYIRDPEASIEVMPWELVGMYNDLVDELTTLRRRMQATIECIKHIGAYVKAAEIAAGKDVHW